MRNIAVLASVIVTASHAHADPEMGTGPLGIEATRNASGTSWQPDSTPMFMWSTTASGWNLALHENLFAGWDAMTTRRGADQFLSINWIMGMASHAIAGGGDVMFRAMLSAEPGTVWNGGYPLLLQTGESFHGEPLHDRQHPHDLFMELAARVREPLTDSLGLELYGGPVGEPALGPPAFPHRFTSLADPLAPLGHHWLDSTHITFGVVTAGLFTRAFKIEGSWFNGREPDERRWDFDFRALDSGSVRVSVNPTRDLSAQVSWGYLASPEQLEPDVSVQRTTASLIWNHPLDGPTRDVGITAAFGRNDPSSGPTTYAGLVEAALVWNGAHDAFTRIEVLTKSGADLALPPAMADATFGMASFSAGYVYDLAPSWPIVPGVGAVGTLDVIGSSLEPAYGTRTPWGGMVFLRLRPPTMHMGMQM